MRILTPILTLVVAFGLLAQAASARPLTTQEKVRDFEQLVSMMKAGYGPLEYKQEAIGKDIDWLHTSYLVDVVRTRSNLDYYYLVNRFVAEFQDAHFAARVPSDHMSFLGFTVDLIDDKVLVEEVMIPDLPLQRGDELLSINGQDVADAMAEIAPYIGMGRDESTRRISALMLTIRSGAALPVPTGPVELVVQRDGAQSDLELSWIESGTPLPEDVLFEREEVVVENHSTRTVYDFELSIRDRLAGLLPIHAERNYFCSGSTRITIPEDATMIMTSPFVAYYHPHPDRPEINIGYLRIPHYMPTMDSEGDADPFVTRFAQYEYAVSILEANTAGLIIDQDHNCGGSVFYLEQLVSLFAERDFEQMQFEFLASRQSALDFQGWLNQMNPNTLDYVDFKVTADLIKDAWENGDRFLTSKIGFLGYRVNRPHHTRYTKPIVMLIDELSGSGGDAFPSILGGIGRARLMGKATMGAGGHVTGAGPLYFSGITLSMTKSLFYRPDGVPVENNGAVPDVEYDLTVNDFVNGYVDMQTKYLGEILSLIEQQ